MKIGDELKSKTISTTKGARASHAGKGGFVQLVTTYTTRDTTAPNALAEAVPCAVIDPLGLIDAIARDRGEAQGKTKKRLHALLGGLEELKHSLLVGAIPRVQLQQLKDALAQHAEQRLEPRLATLVAEIELRVGVELAKYDRNETESRRL